MGVSSRTTRTIEPGNGDLLVPEQGRRLRASRTRDVEDACFETVGRSRDGFSVKSSTGENGSVFKSRLTGSPEHGPFPPDFAHFDDVPRQATDRNRRLGVFGGKATVFAAGESRLSVVVPAIVLTVCGFAATVFWMAGSHAPEPQPQARVQVSSSVPAAAALQVSVPAPLAADPVVTSSIPVTETGRAKAGFTAPTPRPARIERAGSILMIRPAGG